MSHKPPKPLRSGFAIFTTYLFHGPMPSCYDGKDLPVVFATELEAQREIADLQLTRIQEFLDGQRDFEDAISTDEYVQPVIVLPDGMISNAEGIRFGKID